MMRTVPAQCDKPSCYMHFAKTEGEGREVASIKIIKCSKRLLRRTHVQSVLLISDPSLPFSVYLDRHWPAHIINYTIHFRIYWYTVSDENWRVGRSRNKLVLLYTPNISTHYGYLTTIIKLGTRQHLLLWRQSHCIWLIPYMEMYCSGLYCASEPLLISRMYATCTSLRWKLNFRFPVIVWTQWVNAWVEESVMLSRLV